MTTIKELTLRQHLQFAKTANSATILSMTEPIKMMGTLDVAEYLGVSRQYVDRLVRSGKLKCQKTSAGPIFLETGVAAFKRQRLRQAKRDPRVRIRK